MSHNPTEALWLALARGEESLTQAVVARPCLWGAGDPVASAHTMAHVYNVISFRPTATREPAPVFGDGGNNGTLSR